MKSMLKNVASALTVGFLAGALIGCGNSPDGDGMKPVDGEYGRMSDLYGPAGDGSSRRMRNTDPNVDPSQRRMKNTDPNVDPTQRRMRNN